MSQQYVEIAPNYAMTSRLGQVISSAMGESHKFTLRNAQYVEKVPELMLDDTMINRLNYLKYPENIQPLVKPTKNWYGMPLHKFRTGNSWAISIRKIHLVLLT